MSKSRNVWKIVFENFVKSFRPRQIRGNLMGKDYFGNKFYEIPPNPSIGKRKASRWFEPKEKEDFMQDVPAEWEAWLRGRRADPPTEEELMKSLAIMQMKKRNAKALEEKYNLTRDKTALPKDEKGYGSFPKYDEYEVVPGTPKKKIE